MFAQNSDGSYDASKLTLDNPAGVKFAAALKTWGAERTLNPNIAGDIAATSFEKGEAPYFLTGAWNIGAIKKAGITYAIDSLPTAGGEPAQPFLGVNAFFISTKSKNKVAATKFLVNYLGTDAVPEKLYEVGDRAPALTSAFKKISAANADVQAFGKVGLHGVPMPSIPQMASVWAHWGSAELALIKGEGDPATVWNTAVTNVQAEIKG